MNEQPSLMNQQLQHQQPMNINLNLKNINPSNPHQHSQPQMLPITRSYGMWAPQQPQPPFQNPNANIGVLKPKPSAFNKPSNLLGPRSNWKGKRTNKPYDNVRKESQISQMLGSYSAGAGGGGVNVIHGGEGSVNFNNYDLPSLNELQHQNRLKTRKFFPKKKFNKNSGVNSNMGYNYNKNSRSAPFAPRNTTSFLIRAKKSGGIASLVSPCPVTPAVLPTPIFSPSREVLVDMAKEEWGVDGYGSMKGFIRLRSPGNEMEVHEDDEEDEGGSSESDVEEHVEVERRLDHDLSRFEMIYDPISVNAGGMDYHSVLENRVDDQDAHIAQLEDENMILKERLFLMERELGDLTMRLLRLEKGGNSLVDNEEVVGNESDDGSQSREYVHSMEETKNGFDEETNNRKDRDNHQIVDDHTVLVEKAESENIRDVEEKVEKQEELVQNTDLLDEIKQDNEDSDDFVCRN